MPQIPIVIPLIAAGIFLGSIWSNKSLAGVWRRTLITATISGLLNSGYAWLLRYLKLSGADLSVNGAIAFVATSGLSGFLIVLTVFLSAAGMIRYRRRKELEPEE